MAKIKSNEAYSKIKKLEDKPDNDYYKPQIDKFIEDSYDSSLADLNFKTMSKFELLI